jgi:thiamine biosynthesis protein ThiS
MDPSTSKAKRIHVTVNGDRGFDLPEPATVQALVARCRPRPPFAIELNQKLVSHRLYAETPLADGDRVEIVELVGGG